MKSHPVSWIEPSSPANDLQVGKIRLPLLIDGRGLVCELAGGLHDDEGRTGDQSVGFEKPVNRDFGDKIVLGIGEGHSQLARTQFGLFSANVIRRSRTVSGIRFHTRPGRGAWSCSATSPS